MLIKLLATHYCNFVARLVCHFMALALLPLRKPSLHSRMLIVGARSHT